jgi:hypothetical protein
MRVLNLCSHDYANFSHDNANALRSVGVDCIDIKGFPHEFNYETESTIYGFDLLNEEFKKADVIQLMHSDLNLARYISQNKRRSQKYCVWHTGTAYRQQPDRYNRLFNAMCDKVFIALGEFANMGAKNAQYLVGAIDTERIQADINGSKVIGHYPSNIDNKGTVMVGRLVRQCGYGLDLKTEKVSYKEQLKRYDNCGIYIEMFNLKQRLQPYGSWGITALEAACKGRVIITNQNNNEYSKVYGNTELLICNNEKEFKERLQGVMNIDIKEKQIATRKWVEENHSYKAAGERLKNILHGL